MKPAILFDEVSKHYKLYHHLRGGIKNFLVNFGNDVLAHEHFVALDCISFSIEKGETVGIVGKNGSGKSTILGLVAGVEKPTSGVITTEGRIVSMLELGGGFHPDLSGRENIILNGVLLGLTRKEANERMESIIDYSELGEFIDEPIRVYSSGMLARLGFSIMTRLEPDILIVDEVLAVGDRAFQDKCLGQMKAFKEAGVTILLVSHEEEDIRSVCDRVIWIDEHRIRMNGDVETVMQAYTQSQHTLSGNGGRNLH